MKKFLLLIVGVLFALSANAAQAWTIYADVSAKKWDNVWLWYGDFKTPVQGWIVDPVNKIYKFQFEQDGDFNMSFTNYGENIQDKDHGSTRVGDFSTNNDDDYWKVVNNALYTFKDGNNNGTSKKPAESIYTEEPAVYLVGKFGGVDHWTPGTNAYKFEGPWNNLTLDLTTVKGDDDSSLSSITTDDEFAIVCLNDNKWHKNEGKESQKLLNKDESYQTHVDTKINIKVSGTINNPVISLNSYNWQITITEKAGTPTPDPTDPEYTYYIHSNFSGSWPDPSDAILMTKEGDTWTWEGTVANDGSAFGIKRLSAGEELSDKNTWIFANKGNSTLSDGSELGAIIENAAKDNGENFTVSSKGKYKITFNPTTNTVKLESTTTPETFTYTLHGQIGENNNEWKDYEMTQISNGANWWYLEGKFSTGSFGIKKMDKNNNQWTNGTSDNTWGWIRSNEETFTITPGESWHAAVVQTPAGFGTGNWKFEKEELFNSSTKYTIMFNADDLKILVSTVAASGVEDINVDEDAPVEYFNLQGQRVNGELTPGIYIRRQGSTVTKVRF